MPILLALILMVGMGSAATTEVHIVRLADDGITIVNETTVTYQWMEAKLPVFGDGNTYYYYQGPIFEGEWETNYGVNYPEYRTDWEGTPPLWTASEERWDRFWNGNSYVQNEEVNWQSKNLGKLKGTNIKDLCDLVGGIPVGQKIRVAASDNVFMDLPYSAIYEPTPQLGPYVLTWWSVGAGESGATSGYTGPDYTNGMRATFFADTSRNPSGEHVAGLGDQAEGLPEEYWYYFGGDYPSMGGWTLKYVDRIYVYTYDPVPPPTADFSANTKTGRIINGDFETGELAPWIGFEAAVSDTYSYKKDIYSVRLLAPASGTSSIQQTIDLTDVGSIYFWRHYFGGAGKYMEVLIDTTVIANYTETSTIPNDYENIDISSYGFSGLHTVTFRAVNTNPSGSFTVYLDNIIDYGPGTSGNAPLTVQFKDLSSKMEDIAHTSWAWDFENDGIIDSTVQNPMFTYPTTGIYTVKLTATNAGGSDGEIKTDYILVGVPVPVAEFSGTPASGYAPLTVTFTDLSTNTPTSWLWNFGDEGTSTLQNPSHQYLSSGTYTVTLTATNSYGSDSETKTGYIVVDQALDANFYGSVNTTTNGGFEDLLSGWTNSGDVTTVTTPVHSGLRAAKINSPTTTTPANCSQSIDLTDVDEISYYYQIPVINTGNVQVSIDGAVMKMYSSQVSSYTHDTIDTSGYSGSHLVSFVASSTKKNNPLTLYLDDVVTLSNPSGSIIRSPPVTVYFTDTSTNNPTSWYWIFGDGGTATEQNPSHTYTATGSYTVSLTATNTLGSDTESKIAYVVTGTTPTIDIDTTGGITNWAFLTGTNMDTTSVDLSVSTTASSWEVRVKDGLDDGKPADTAGRMSEYTGSAYVTSGYKSLANALQVNSGTGDYVTVLGSDQMVQEGSSPGTFTSDIGIKQEIVAGDQALTSPNVYRIVVTFTGATN